MFYLKLQLLGTDSYLTKENGGIFFFCLVVHFEQLWISIWFLLEFEILTMDDFKSQLIKVISVLWAIFCLWNLNPSLTPLEDLNCHMFVAGFTLKLLILISSALLILELVGIRWAHGSRLDVSLLNSPHHPLQLQRALRAGWCFASSLQVYDQ